MIHLDNTNTFQVNTSCEDLNAITTQSWFILPPLVEYYYKKKNPFYKSLPPFRPDCLGENAITMQFIYPKNASTIFLPKDFNETVNELILKVAHSKKNSTLYWYIDKTYIGQTTDIHDMAILPEIGEHWIVVVDNFGNELKRKVTISK